MIRMTPRILPLIGLLAWSAAAHAETPVKTFDGATPLVWSERMADSEMARLGATLEAGHDHARWDYSPAVLALGLWRLGAATGNDSYREFAGRAVGSFVRQDGSIIGFKPSAHALDSINPGKVVLLLAEYSHEKRYGLAAERLRAELAVQPRTKEGGYWHKERYPHQMWLDGVYMASPFMARYAAQYHEPALFDDVANQILIADRHLYDPSTGLYWHAWDESHSQAWADPGTGHSPNFWSRSIGWYAMAIVDSLRWFPAGHPKIAPLTEVLTRVADGVVRWQDPKTGLWWQVTNEGGRKGNYLEASASSMFVYALAKAVNEGYLPREQYLPAILKGYAGLVRTLVKTEPDGRISLEQICQSAGLGFRNSAGVVRDGSFGYYIGEPVVANDPKGTGPFIMAGIEVQKLLAGGSRAEASVGWSALPGILKKIHAPVFPDRDFPITAYGAKPGEDATSAIHAAIAACSAAGGGRVVVPAGDWLTGAVRLESHVNLHISKGATLRFSTDPAAYPTVYTRWEGVECMNYSALIYAYGQKDIAVTGEGTLDGQASNENWWAWKTHRADRDKLNEMGEAGVPVAQRVFGLGHYLRPNFFQTYRCRNVLIEGVTIVRSPMWELHPVLSENVTVRGVKIHSHGPNNDGCDPESSRDVLIDHCVFDTGDDCIAIKSGRNNDGRRVNIPAENIVVRDCTMQDGHGGVVIGSEVSGGCRNVFAENCSMDSPHLDRALRIKSNAQRGGVIENIFMRNVRVGRVAEAILTVDFLYEEGARGHFPPIVRHVRLDHIMSEHSPRVMWIAGFPAATIDDIRFDDCTFRGVETAEVISHAGRIVLDHVTIVPEKKMRSLNSRPPETPVRKP